MRQILQKYTPAYSKQPGFQEIGTPLHQVGGIFYLGEYNEWEPDYDNPIWDLNEWQKVQAHIKSAGVDPDPIGSGMAGIMPEYYSSAREILSDVDQAIARAGKYGNYRKYIKNAAILKREDFGAFKTIQTQARVLATKVRKHILLDLITIDNVSEYNTKLYSLDGPYDMVQENLAELSVPNITGFPSLTPMEFGIERYGIHYGFSEEFLAETFDFNLKKIHTDNVVGQMDLVFAKKVADMFNNLSTFTTYADWTAKTGLYSNRDPAEDIYAEATKIFATERNEDVVVLSNLKTYNAFWANTFMNHYGTPSFEQKNFSFGNQIATNIARFEGLRWGIDSFMAAQKFVAFDPSAVYAARMPQRIVDYKSPYGTYQGTIIRQNFVVKPIDTNRILGGSAVTP